MYATRVSYRATVPLSLYSKGGSCALDFGATEKRCGMNCTFAATSLGCLQTWTRSGSGMFVFVRAEKIANMRVL